MLSSGIFRNVNSILRSDALFSDWSHRNTCWIPIVSFLDGWPCKSRVSPLIDERVSRSSPTSLKLAHLSILNSIIRLEVLFPAKIYSFAADDFASALLAFRVRIYWVNLPVHVFILDALAVVKVAQISIMEKIRYLKLRKVSVSISIVFGNDINVDLLAVKGLRILT